jgi:hypothetical protein
MKKRLRLIFMFFLLCACSNLFAMEQPRAAPRPLYRGIEDVIIQRTEVLAPGICKERFKTKIYIEGLQHPLWY